jgi:hypothetical protein
MQLNKIILNIIICIQYCVVQENVQDGSVIVFIRCKWIYEQCLNVLTEWPTTDRPKEKYVVWLSVISEAKF